MSRRVSKHMHASQHVQCTRKIAARIRTLHLGAFVMSLGPSRGAPPHLPTFSCITCIHFSHFHSFSYPSLERLPCRMNYLCSTRVMWCQVRYLGTWLRGTCAEPSLLQSSTYRKPVALAPPAHPFCKGIGKPHPRTIPSRQ